MLSLHGAFEKRFYSFSQIFKDPNKTNYCCYKYLESYTVENPSRVDNLHLRGSLWAGESKQNENTVTTEHGQLGLLEVALFSSPIYCSDMYISSGFCVSKCKINSPSSGHRRLLNGFGTGAAPGAQRPGCLIACS